MERHVLKLQSKKIAGRVSTVAGAWLLCATAVHAQSATPAPDNGTFDVEQVFAGTCGFCHSDGGRAAGKGPQLMGTSRDDSFIAFRIMNGKEGRMPAFGSALTGEQVLDVIAYIRSLKE